MNAVKVIVGFVPLVVFSALSTAIGAGWASVLGLAAAVVVIGVDARDGIKLLPTVQAAILAAMSVLAWTGGASTDASLVKYGPALQGLLLGLFILATAATVPFTAQYARASVPPEVTHTRRFLEVNQRISTAWGFAILVVGVCHLAAAEISITGWHLALRLAVNWVLPIIALMVAVAHTKRVVAAARQEAGERQAHGAEQVRS